MQGMGVSLGARLAVTDRARRAMSQVCRAQGPQVVVLARSGRATYMPLVAYRPSKHNVVIGHIAGCPVYADMRRLSWSSRTRVVLDVVEMPGPGRRLFLHVRPAVQAPARAAAASDSVARIVDELYREFSDSTPEVVVRASLANALADLRGSISQEALPEMAVRLARVRLAARASAPISQVPSRSGPCVSGALSDVRRVGARSARRRNGGGADKPR
jgi:uncharacterized protein (DUF779 family)